MAVWIMGILLTILLLVLAVGITEYGIFMSLFFRPRRFGHMPRGSEHSLHYQAAKSGLEYMEKLHREDAYIRSRDGLKLHAAVFPAADKPKNFILAIHGYKSDAWVEFGPYIEWYHSLGYTMVLPDDRAHGPSEGRYIGFGVLDRLDCIDWAKWIADRYGPDCRILLHGVSMGAATVLAASGEPDLPDQVFGIVEDCGYTTAWDVLTYQIREVRRLPVKLILPACEKICRKLAGYDFHSFTPLEQVSRARVPVLFIHGTADHMVPCRMADQLYAACPARKKKLMVEGAGHAVSIALAPDTYHRTVREFFGI